MWGDWQQTTDQGPRQRWTEALEWGPVEAITAQGNAQGLGSGPIKVICSDADLAGIK